MADFCMVDVSSRTLFFCCTSLVRLSLFNLVLQTMVYEHSEANKQQYKMFIICPNHLSSIHPLFLLSCLQLPVLNHIKKEYIQGPIILSPLNFWFPHWYIISLVLSLSGCKMILAVIDCICFLFTFFFAVYFIWTKHIVLLCWLPFKWSYSESSFWLLIVNYWTLPILCICYAFMLFFKVSVFNFLSNFLYLQL